MVPSQYALGAVNTTLSFDTRHRVGGADDQLMNAVHRSATMLLPYIPVTLK